MVLMKNIILLNYLGLHTTMYHRCTNIIRRKIVETDTAPRSKHFIYAKWLIKFPTPKGAILGIRQLIKKQIFF